MENEENGKIDKNEEKDSKKSVKERFKELSEEHEKFKADYNRMKEELKLAKDATKESMEMVKNFKLDVDRIKERSEELNNQLHEKITMEVIGKILPTLDNFENAIRHMAEGSQEKKGCEMIYKALIKQLEDLDVKQITCTAGVFDPGKMEAISIVPTDKPELVGTVAKVLSNGYYYYPTDNVIRYTQVAVFK